MKDIKKEKDQKTSQAFSGEPRASRGNAIPPFPVLHPVFASKTLIGLETHLTLQVKKGLFDRHPQALLWGGLMIGEQDAVPASGSLGSRSVG